MFNEMLTLFNLLYYCFLYVFKIGKIALLALTTLLDVLFGTKMFGAIYIVLDTLFNIIYYCYLYSVKIGQFLVLTATTLLDVSWFLISNLCEMVCVITDSLEIFLLDILDVLQSVLGTFGHARNIAEKSLHNNVDHFLSTLLSVYNYLECCVFSVGGGLKQLCMFVKHLFVLFGSGVYFSITFIPLTIGSIFMLFMDVLDNIPVHMKEMQTKSIELAKNCAINLYDFFTDVPIESAIGIVIAASLIYIFTHFYVIIFSYLYSQTRTSLLNLYNKVFRSQQSNMIHQNGSNIQGRGGTSPKYASSDERYCVICQERLKCILVLPCRHVCMCSECNFRLQMYHSTCPICRNDIDSTMKIFV